jgi:hypothetical protein
MIIDNPTLVHFRHFSSLFTPSALYICREPSTNQLFLCKTNPILSAVGGLQMNISFIITMAYENKRNWTLSENKPNQTQFLAHKIRPFAYEKKQNMKKYQKMLDAYRNIMCIG